MRAIESLAYNLVGLQKHAALSPAEFAARVNIVNIPADYLQRLLQGQEDCTVELLERLADILRMQRQDLLHVSRSSALGIVVWIVGPDGTHCTKRSCNVRG